MCTKVSSILSFLFGIGYLPVCQYYPYWFSNHGMENEWIIGNCTNKDTVHDEDLVYKL